MNAIEKALMGARVKQRNKLIRDLEKFGPEAVMFIEHHCSELATEQRDAFVQATSKDMDIELINDRLDGHAEWLEKLDARTRKTSDPEALIQRLKDAQRSKRPSAANWQNSVSMR